MPCKCVEAGSKCSHCESATVQVAGRQLKIGCVLYGGIPVYRYFYAVLKPVFFFSQTSIPYDMIHFQLIILEASKTTQKSLNLNDKDKAFDTSWRAYFLSCGVFIYKYNSLNRLEHLKTMETLFLTMNTSNYRLVQSIYYDNVNCQHLCV